MITAYISYLDIGYILCYPLYPGKPLFRGAP